MFQFYNSSLRWEGGGGGRKGFKSTVHNDAQNDRHRMRMVRVFERCRDQTTWNNCGSGGNGGNGGNGNKRQ